MLLYGSLRPHEVMPPLVTLEEDIRHQLRVARVTRGALWSGNALTTAAALTTTTLSLAVPPSFILAFVDDMGIDQIQVPAAQRDYGYTGNKGAKGNTGAQGNAGALGATGYTGWKGYTGAKGNRGYNGNKGSTGNTGARVVRELQDRKSVV